ESRIVVDQSASDAVAHRTRLAGFAAAVDVDFDVERFQVAGQLEWLAHNHAAGFASEEFVDGFTVNDDLARSFFDENTSHRGFATAGSVVPVTDHGVSLDIQRLGLLSGVRVLGTGVHLEFLDHGVAQRTLGQHALDGLLDGAAGKPLLQFLEVRFADAAGVTGVTEVLFVLRLGARNDDLGSVDDDDVIARINVRREVRFVHTTQAACDFAGQTTHDFALGVDQKPVTLDFKRSGHKGLHD